MLSSCARSDKFRRYQISVRLPESRPRVRLPTQAKAMKKSLDLKIADILTNPSGSKAFIIADAKDADMGFGVRAPGPRVHSEGKKFETEWKSLEQYRTQIRAIVRQGIVDIVLLSAHTFLRADDFSRSIEHYMFLALRVRIY